jgi:hypothetical protein
MAAAARQHHARSTFSLSLKDNKIMHPPLRCCAFPLCYTRDEIEAEGRSHELEAMVQFIEHTWNVQLTPGRNSSEWSLKQLVLC